MFRHRPEPPLVAITGPGGLDLTLVRREHPPMAIPDYQTVMLPVLRAAADGEVRVSGTVEKLADEFGLTEDERAELLPSGRQPVIYNRVQWAKTYLTRAGLLKVTRRGHFEITDRGKKALAEHPQKIDNNYLMQFEEFVEFLELENSRTR